MAGPAGPGAASSRVNQPYGGFHPHTAGRYHWGLAKALGATMWFFMFYRIKQDGRAVFLGQHPFDHGAHGDRLTGAEAHDSAH